MKLFILYEIKYRHEKEEYRRIFKDVEYYRYVNE